MKNGRTKSIMALFLMCLVMMLSINTVFAQEQEQQEDVKPEFVLTYPDGSIETATDYDEAKSKLDEWKLLYEGKTDPNGLIELNGWATKGEIKIVEKKVPEGYTAEKTETYVDLSEGEVTIVNKKDEPPTEEEPPKEEEKVTPEEEKQEPPTDEQEPPKEEEKETPKEEPKTNPPADDGDITYETTNDNATQPDKETPAETVVTKVRNGVKTGDSASTLALVSLLALCAAGVSGIVIKRRKEQ